MGSLEPLSYAGPARSQDIPSTYLGLGRMGLDKWVEAIGHAGSDIRVASFSMSHPRVVDALLSARRRGVQIKLLLDAKDKHRADGLMAACDVRWIGEAHGSEVSGIRMHAKVLLIDADNISGSTQYITGSTNPSFFSERSMEDVIVINDRTIVKEKATQFDILWRSIGIQ
jgi:phosphatidylserine/phosphatidylglycerophosphate/cardiolipin synthase-like enzyme